MGGPLVTSIWTPAVPRNQPNVDAGGTARGDPNPSDDQATPSPASPEIAEENVARGIALAVSAGLPDHEGMGGEGSEDVQENAYPPPRADSARDAQEKGGEERAAVEGAAEASTRAPAAAHRPGGSTQHEQAPTNTLARRGARQDDGEAFEPAQSGARARSRRGAQGDADEARQAQAAVASSPDGSITPDLTAADATAADDEATREDEEVVEHEVRTGADLVQAATRGMWKG
ncbi:unnamed protein product [Closterium sp. NIES-64]|nr:unnamed protein product [Closterium sp. NIES-64]